MFVSQEESGTETSTVGYLIAVKGENRDGSHGEAAVGTPGINGARVTCILRLSCQHWVIPYSLQNTCNL